MLRGVVWGDRSICLPNLSSLLRDKARRLKQRARWRRVCFVGSGACLFSIPFASCPIGSISTITGALRSPDLRLFVLFMDVVASIVTILLILLTFRKKGIPNSFIPIRRFRIDKRVLALWALSFLPSLPFWLPHLTFLTQKRLSSPAYPRIHRIVKTASTGGVALAIVSLVVLAPILEEVIFRGLLVEVSHEERRRKLNKYFLDFLACLLFFSGPSYTSSGLRHTLMAAAFIYVRRHTGSLVPSLVMHASWNLSVLVPIFRSYS